MTPFIAGFIVGLAIGCCAFVLFAVRRKKHTELPIWTEAHYQTPVVTTRIVNKHRSIEI